MTYRLVRRKIYPNVHTQALKFQLKATDTTTINGTMIPWIMQDEGLGSPSSKKTCPENASFAEYQGPNCYPESRVNFARGNLEISLDKDTYNSDNIEVLKIGVFPIHTAFLFI